MFVAPPKVVICGSYKKNRDEILKIERSFLALNCQILSPRSLDFNNYGEDFVRTRSEKSFSNDEIERWHLQAITLCDFIWLHCPDGYIGISSSFELGYAYAIDKPCYAFQKPKDCAVDSFVRIRVSVLEPLFELGLLD